MGGLSPLHLLIVLVVALVVIGPGRLPEAGAALGQAMKSMRDALDGVDEVPSTELSGAVTVPGADPAGPPEA